MSSLLSIMNLETGYGKKTIISDISMNIMENEIMAVIGQNGSGKTTLLKCVARLITIFNGEIEFLGTQLNKFSTWDLRKLGIAYLPQTGLFSRTLKVKEHFDLVLREKNRKDHPRLIDECFFYFPELVDLSETRAGNLSGGERQMLSFAILLLMEASFWLLDEPTAGLSPEAVTNSISLLNKMKEEKKISMLLVEHNYQVAFSLADKVSIIKEGRLDGIYNKHEFSEDNFLNNNLYN